MAFYLTRFSYTPATWAKLIKNPEDRRVAAKQYIESGAESSSDGHQCRRSIELTPNDPTTDY